MQTEEREAPRLRYRLGKLQQDRVVLGACLIEGLTLIESTLSLSEANIRHLKTVMLELVDSCEVEDTVVEASFGFRGSGSFYLRSEKQVIVAIHHLHSADTPLLEARAIEILEDVIQGRSNHATMEARPTNGDSEVPWPGAQEQSWPTIDSNEPTSEVIDNSKPRTTDPLSDMFKIRNGTKDTVGDREDKPILDETPPASDGASQSGMMLRKKDGAKEARTVMPWKEFRNELQLILSKVMGDAQASQMVGRHLANYEIDEEADFRIPDLMQFGTEILERIPNKIKRKNLLEELTIFLK